MRGRHPKPAALHAIEGTGRGKIRNELKPNAGLPEPPAYFSGERLSAWHRIVSALPPGLLTKADQQVLERMSTAWATFQQAATRLAETEDLLVDGHQGEQVRNPLTIIAKQAADEMQRCGMELGLSPLARTRLGQPSSTETDNPMERLFGVAGFDHH